MSGVRRGLGAHILWRVLPWATLVLLAVTLVTMSFTRATVERAALDWLERIKMREPFFMMAMAITIGICAGFGAVAFRHLIELMNWLFWGAAHATPDFLRELPVWRLILIPAAGGLLAASDPVAAQPVLRGPGPADDLEDLFETSPYPRSRPVRVLDRSGGELSGDRGNPLDALVRFNGRKQQ